MCFVIFAIAAGIFVATGDFLLGSLLPYVWAAWPSVESAFWLRTKDPVRERGKTCFWFYLSAGSSAGPFRFLNRRRLCSDRGDSGNPSEYG